MTLRHRGSPAVGLCVLVLALALAGCSSTRANASRPAGKGPGSAGTARAAPSPMPTILVATGHVPPGGHETDVLMLPAGYRRDGTVRGVVFCHGAGELASTPLAGASLGKAKETDLVEAIASVYPMVMFDAGVPGAGIAASDNWGNPNAVARLGQAISWLQAPGSGGGAKAGKVLLIGLSMGHSLAMNYAQANPATVAAIVGILPVVDLDQMRDTEPVVRASISDAWGTGPWVRPGTPPLPAGANPALPADYSHITRIPHRMYYAPDDMIVTAPTVLALKTGLGAAATTVELGDGGHSDQSVGHVPVADLLQFLAANA